ncbi:MAG: YHYH domain-containing protein [Patescibacteria group bacterium]
MRTALFIIIALAIPSISFAHGGRTNAEGCHNDRKNGGYHCHNAKTSAPSPQRQSNEPTSPSASAKARAAQPPNKEGIPVDIDVVKKSKSGICHAPETTYYSRTTNFSPYTTLDECIASGGRLPAR